MRSECVCGDCAATHHEGVVLATCRGCAGAYWQPTSAPDLGHCADCMALEEFAATFGALPRADDERLLETPG